MSVDHNLSCFDIHQKKAVDGRFPLQPRNIHLRRLRDCAAGEGAVADRDIRLSPKAIRLTDERDAPAAKRSGRVSARCTCDEVVRSPDE